MRKIIKHRFALLFVLCLLLIPATAQGQAVITIINNDGAGEGFNDPTPAAPVGGNAGTTIGQQRLIAFQHAATLWGATVASNVPIVIRANFDPLSCTATSATLGSAGSASIFANFPAIAPFPGPEFANTWYPSALADKRAGQELNPGQRDITAQFNSNLGAAGCLTGIFWYYGLDNNHGNNVDLVTVLLHEFGHGLGFQQFGSLTSGANVLGLTDVYQRKLFDKTLLKTWDQMTNAERVLSAKNYRKVVWIGPRVTSAVPLVLSAGTPLLTVNPPSAILGYYPVGLALFGGALTTPGVTANIVQALDPADGAGPLTTDGCSPLTNAAAIAGKIALIDRGTCGFTVKAKNAQDAGAIAAIIANNAGGPVAGLAGVDPTITIPTVLITLNDGNLIKPQLGLGVNATLGVNLAIRQGADDLGNPFVFSPDPVQGGSSISHWDTGAFRNQLMEPSINGDLTHSLLVPEDMTLAQMRDIGWFPDADLDGVPDENDTCILQITTTSLPAGISLTPYSQQLSVSPAGSYTFSLVQGNLPSGLTLSATGLISGFALVPGTYNFSVRAQIPGGCNFTRALSITINCATITLNPASLPGGTIGGFYSQSITATPAGSYSYSVAGTLPPGLTLQPSGLLSGTPTANGTFNFTVTATGTYGCAGSKAYSIVIAPGACPTITLSSLPNGVVGTLYVGFVSASPAGSYAWTLAGTLPPGLSFYPTIGLVFGYPTAAGTFNFTITATDPNNCTGTGTYAIPIAP